MDTYNLKKINLWGNIKLCISFILILNCNLALPEKKEDNNSKLITALGILNIIEQNSTTCIELPEKIDSLVCKVTDLTYTCTDGSNTVAYTFSSILNAKRSLYLPISQLYYPDIQVGNFANKIEFTLPNSKIFIPFYANEFDSVTNHVTGCNVVNGYKLSYRDFDKNGYPKSYSLNLNPFSNTINNYSITWEYETETSTKPKKAIFNITNNKLNYEFDSRGFTTKGDNVLGGTVTPTYTGTITMCSKK